MKLIRISAKNFKGLDFDDELGRLTVYGGANFAGKSARLDAIRLLILGYLPELGKQNRETFRLSSGAAMSVTGIFETEKNLPDLATVTRSWRLEGDSIKKEISGPIDIRELLDEDDRLRVMLDADSYFALTERQRVAYLFANTKMPDEWTGAAVRERVQKALAGLPRAEKDDVRDRIDQLFFTGTTKHKLALPELIESVATGVTEVEAFEREYAVRMEKTIQGLSSLRLEDGKTEADGPLLELNETLLRRRLVESDDYYEKKAKFGAILASRRRRSEIQSEVRAVAGMEGKLADLKGRLSDATERLELVRPATAKEEAEYRDEGFMARGKLSNAQAAFNRHQTIFQTIEKKIAGIDSATECPYCGATGDSWKAKRKAELTSELALCEAEIKKCADEIPEHAKEVNRVADVLKTVESAKRRHTELSAARAGLKDEIANVEKFLARTEGLKAEETRLAPEDPELETATKMAELQLQKTTAEIDDVVARRHKIAGRTEELKRLATAELGRDKAKVNQEVAKAAGAALREVKAEIVEKALQPLLASANSIFHEILPTPIAYHDGEIGTYRGSLWVSHHTLSGLEKALTYGAIQAALAEQSPIRLMLFDELARIDNVQIDRFFDCVARAVVDGRIDSFVGVDPSRKDSYVLWGGDLEFGGKTVSTAYHEVT